MNTRSTCVECPQWTPSRRSKYNNCKRWWTHRLSCDLPKEACETCDHHMDQSLIPTGRPNETGIDWNDREEVREYYSQKKREQRQRDGQKNG